MKGKEVVTTKDGKVTVSSGEVVTTYLSSDILDVLYQSLTVRPVKEGEGWS
jgi:hypothetical protein